MGNNPVKSQDNIHISKLLKRINKEDYQYGNIIWIDPKVNNTPENLDYQKLINKMGTFNLFPFTKTKDCIKKLMEINDFKKTFVIVSGSKLNEFSEEFNKIINDIKVVPEILIFTSYKNYKRIKENILNENCPLLDINSIFLLFEPIQNRFKKSNLYIPIKNELTKDTQDEEIFCFEYIKESKELILPLHFRDFLEYPNKNEIIKFNRFLLDNFSQSSELNDLVQQLLIKTVIPCQILIKYYIRIYTLQSKFYKIMNNCLIRKFGKDYETYIKVVYHGLYLKSIPLAIKKKLYRGTRIKQSELEYIKNSLKNKKDGISTCICYSKAFYSTSSLKQKALEFMLTGSKNEKEEYVLYKIKEGKKIDEEIVSNSNIEKFSKYPLEKENLFFPFSSFEITKEPKKKILKMNNNKECSYYKIYLEYLGKYRDKIDIKEKIPETGFTKNFLKTDLMDKFEMEKEPEKFNFNIRNYISPEQRKNYIYAIYEIKNDDLNKNIKILNYNDSNKEEIEKLCNIYLNDEKINFDFEYKFDRVGKYNFIYEFSDLLTNASKLFYECNLLISLDFQSFKTNYITDMSDMFNGCSSIKSLDLSNFKTKRVINMKQMFCDCKLLENLDLSSFKTNNVTDMTYMFNNCNSLSFLNLSNFETNNTKYMFGMFNNCNSLINLNLSNFKTEQVNNMSKMFSSCSSLNILDLSKFDTLNTSQMDKMFYQCSSLTSLNINNFNTEKVTTMENMFTECSSLKNLDVSNFKTNEVKNMKEMFKKCSSLTFLNLINFDTNNVNNMENMFLDCNSLSILMISQKFKIKNNALIGLHNNCKIKYDDKELNPSEINSFYNNDDDKKSINSSFSSNINKDYDSKSSLISNFTNKILEDNNIIKDYNKNNE